MLNRKLLLVTTMAGGLIAPAAAWAQEPDAEVEALVVTGTRLPATVFDTPAPVDIIETEDSALKGLFDAGQILQAAPIALSSVQQTGMVTGFIGAGGPGVSTISLRGLGDQRTLVLMNGRRLPPAGVGGQVGAVDLNILPGAAIDRFEILKDGASAIYGSDAVAGVVNIITRDLEGGLLMADGMHVTAGGGEEYRLSGAYGRSFERGRFQVSAEWRRQEELTLGDRYWLDCAQPYTFDPATGERNDLIDPATGRPKCGEATSNSIGYVNVYEAITLDGENILPVLYGRLGPISAFGPGGGADPYISSYRSIALAERDYDPQAEDDTTILSPADRYTLFANGELTLGAMEGYGEFLWSRRETSQKDWQTIFQPISPLAPCVVNPLAFGCPGGSVRGVFTPAVTPGYAPTYFHVGFAPLTQFLAANEDEQTVEVSRTVLGLRGALGLVPGWDWDAHVSYSRSRGEYVRTGIYADRMQAVTGTDDVGKFLGFCPAGSAPGCAPLDFFTDEILTTGLLPQSYLDYLRLRETGETDYDQLVAEAVISGPLFALPGGQAHGAFGVAYRKEELDDRPGTEAVAANYWGTATAGRTQGEDNVREAFAEVGLPVTASLSFNLSGRYSDYDSYGSSAVWRAGANWRLTEELRLRATAGTSFRAPALYEQFLKDQTAYLPQFAVDPCINAGDRTSAAIVANCEDDTGPGGGVPDGYAGPGGNVELTIGGGENLEPEESTSYSLGAVWESRALGVSLAADYWQVEIENEVVSLAAAVVGQCYASADFPDSPFCDLFTRVPGGTITEVDASFRNIVSQETRGIDLTARAERDVGAGRLTVDVDATWTLEDERELFGGWPDQVNGTIGQPEFVAAASLRYDVGPWTATWASDYIGEQSNYSYQFGARCAAASGAATFAGPAGVSAYCAKNHVEAVWYHHASLRFDGGDWSITGGMRNLADEVPPFVTGAIEPDMGEATYSRLGLTPATSQYDLLGRRFFLSVRKAF